MALDLSKAGLSNISATHRNLPTPALYEAAVRRNEGMISHHGPFVVRTGQYTGRSPNDKFTVKEPSSQDKVWWGKVNRPFDAEAFDRLHARLAAFLQGREVFVQDCWGGADPGHRMPIRIVTTEAWHSLFARNMFVRENDRAALERFDPQFTVISAPGFKAMPSVDGTNSEAFVIVHYGKRLVIIGGTSYAGEIKKSIFTVLNFLLPQEGVLGMHCSANVGKRGDVAIFFGLSGTGKTTLSADPERSLIGDDEHGWGDSGVFNFEGGCYAKVINLSAEAEPEIYACTRRFGTVLENVVIDPVTRRVDLGDGSLTENTRASYPITHIPNIVTKGYAEHPRAIIMLTADAFGVLPPVARLTADQARYHFMSGYTAKVAGTERGVKEPTATFSTCFGAPFMTLHPTVYSKMLGDKIGKHKVECYLINTGWSGGPYGVGSRIKIGHTRALVHAALDGKLASTPMREDPVFGVQVPTSCDGVPSEILDPRNTWSDKTAYDEKARMLAQMFQKNFEEYSAAATPEVRAAGPRVR